MYLGQGILQGKLVTVAQLCNAQGTWWCSVRSSLIFTEEHCRLLMCVSNTTSLVYIATVPPSFVTDMQPQNEFHFQPNSLFPRNLHWKGCNLNPWWDTRMNPSNSLFPRNLHWKGCNLNLWWDTTWTRMNPHCNWDDFFGVKSTSNVLQWYISCLLC